MMKKARNRGAIKHRTLSRHRAQDDQALGLHPHIAHRQLVGPPPTGNPRRPIPGSAPHNKRARTKPLSQFFVPTIQAGRCHQPLSKPGGGEEGGFSAGQISAGPGPGFSDRKRWVFPRSAGLRGGRGVVLRGRWGPPRDPQVWPRPAGSEAASRGLRSRSWGGPDQPRIRPTRARRPASFAPPCLSFLTCLRRRHVPRRALRAALTARAPLPPTSSRARRPVAGGRNTLPGPRGPRGGPSACAGSRLRLPARHSHVTRPAPRRGSVPARLWRCRQLGARVQPYAALGTRSQAVPGSHSSSCFQSFTSGDPRLLIHCQGRLLEQKEALDCPAGIWKSCSRGQSPFSPQRVFEQLFFHGFLA